MFDTYQMVQDLFLFFFHKNDGYSLYCIEWLVQINLI